MVIYARGKTLQAGFDFSPKWLKGETIVVAVNSFICRLPQCFLAYIFFEKFLLNPMVEASAKPGTRFLKVPKLFGRVSGDIILFVSSKRRRLEAQNFAVCFSCFPFTTHEKTSPAELAVRSFTNGFSGPKSFRNFRETGHRVFLYCIDRLADFAILVNIKALSNIIVAKVPKSLIFGF